eukprot:g4892.t1
MPSSSYYDPGANAHLWEAAAERLDKMDNILYFDAIGILKAYTIALGKASEMSPTLLPDSVFLKLTEDITSQASRLAVPHILQTLEICERLNQRPRVLYVELFHHLVRLAPSMYAEEVVNCFLRRGSTHLSANFKYPYTLARLELRNPYLQREFSKHIVANAHHFRFLHLCALQCCFSLLDGGAAQVLSLEEVYETLTRFPALEFSYKPFEDALWAEFLRRLDSEVKDTSDVDTLAEPMTVLRMLHARGAVTENMAKAFAQWAYDASYRPNMLSWKRPTGRDLLFLQTVVENFVVFPREAEVEHARKNLCTRAAAGEGSDTAAADGTREQNTDFLSKTPVRIMGLQGGHLKMVDESLARPSRSFGFHRRPKPNRFQEGGFLAHLEPDRMGGRKSAIHLCKLAVRNFLASKGGGQQTHLKKRPTLYRKGRNYWKMADPCEERKVAKIEGGGTSSGNASARNRDYTATEHAKMWSHNEQRFICQPVLDDNLQRKRKKFKKRPYPAYLSGGEVDPVRQAHLLVRPFCNGALTTYYLKRDGPKKNNIHAK